VHSVDTTGFLNVSDIVTVAERAKLFCLSLANRMNNLAIMVQFPLGILPSPQRLYRLSVLLRQLLIVLATGVEEPGRAADPSPLPVAEV
jgi:hypothetical protein